MDDKLNMKVLLLIDNLNSGGAQRQIINLAVGLKRKNIDVVIITYAKGDHFHEKVIENDIQLRPCIGSSKINTFYRVIKEVKSQDPKIVCAFLFTPSLIALLSKFILKKGKVFVSERFTEHLMTDWSKRFCRALYPMANGIVANSFTQYNTLRKKLPKLKDKIFYIPNSVDLKQFKPTSTRLESEREIRLIGVGRIIEYKNIKVIIHAMRILTYEKNISLKMTWVGREYEEMYSENTYYQECKEMLSEYNLSHVWQWAGNRKNVSALYNASDALVHSSYGEGFPNVICEALASGLPVIASDVLDHPLIISEGKNGFLFDPTSSRQLADKILLLWQLPDEQKDNIRRNARNTALNNFSPERMIQSYHKLFTQPQNIEDTAAEIS